MIFKFGIEKIGIKGTIKEMSEGMKEWVKDNPERVKQREWFPIGTKLEHLSLCLELAENIEDLEAIAEEMANLYVELKVMIDKKKGVVC